MRLGPLEIVIIIMVILLAAVALRIVRTGRNTAGKGKKSSLEIPKRQVEQSTGKGHRLKLAGIVFILISILLLLAGIDLFKWVLRSYLWSFFAMAIGLAILFMSRKR